MNEINKMEELKIGDTGQEVTFLQQMLRINNYFPASITGSFGPDLEKYVKNFQRDNDLIVTGIVNKETWNKLYELTVKPITISVLDKRNLKLGDEGEDVKEVKEKLKTLLYYMGEINTIFDAELQRAVEEFQFINKLIPNGIIDTSTWSSLITLYNPLSNCKTFNDEFYIVKAGDTLYSISEKFNISIEELKRINNLESNTLSIGQNIKIVDNDDDLDITEYIVQKGDTLYSIAKKFSMSVEELETINGLSSDVLSIGQKLKVSKTNDEEIPSLNTEEYIVKSGDTLYSIAKKFNITIEELKDINDLNLDVISINQILKVVKLIENSYTVEFGDTLYGIAKKYSTTVDKLIQLNGLKNNILTIGQILKIS